MNKRPSRIWVGLLILLVAVFARVWAMGDVPPGLQHDEIFKAEDAQRLVEAGDFRFFYPSNQGHEGGYVWLIGVAYLLFGTSMLTVKFPAFVCGLLTVALLYRVIAEIYHFRVATLAASLAAVSFFMIFTSRVGLRAVSLPMVTLLVIWGLHRLSHYRKQDKQRRWGTALLTGLALGLAIYTYTAAFALYVAFGAFLLTLVLVDRTTLKRRGLELLMVTIVGGVLTLPMIDVRLNDPQGQNRVSSITLPLDEFRQGNPQPLIDNAVALIGMPVFTGDPEWRYNVSERPLFILPVGMLVYLGFAIMVRRIARNPINIIWITLAIVGLIPSLLTVLAPSFLRSIVVLPGLLLFAVIAIDAIGRRWLDQRLPHLAMVIGIGLVGITAVADWNAYFSQWPQNAEVHRIYLSGMNLLADYLRDDGSPIAFVSTADRELDPLVYNYVNPSADTRVVFFDGFANIVLSREPTLLFVSPLSTISEAHADWLTEANGTAYIGQITRDDGTVAFDVYRLSDSGAVLDARIESVAEWAVYPAENIDAATPIAEWGEPLSYPVNFGNTITLLGIEVPRLEVYNANDGVNLQLYMQPLTDNETRPLNVFVHLVRALDIPPVAQRDLMGVPPPSWDRRIIFMQDNFVPFWNPVDEGIYLLVMGIYNVETNERLPILDHDGNPISDRIVLARIQVQLRPSE